MKDTVKIIPHKCLGARFANLLTLKGVVVSESAMQAYRNYKTEAGKIVGYNPSGAPLWDKLDNEKASAFTFLDIRKEFAPMWLEVSFWEQWGEKGIEEGYFYRDENNELRATDTYIEVCSQKVMKALNKIKNAIKNKKPLPKEVIGEEEEKWGIEAVYIDQHLYIPYPIGEIALFDMITSDGGLAYHAVGIATNLLNLDQKNIVARNVLAVREKLRKLRPKEKKYKHIYKGLDIDWNRILSSFKKAIEEDNAISIKPLHETESGTDVVSDGIISHAIPPLASGRLWTDIEIDKWGHVVGYQNQTKAREITYIITDNSTQNGTRVIEVKQGQEAWAIAEVFGRETVLLHLTLAGLCLEMPLQDLRMARGRIYGSKLIKLLRLNEQKKTVDGKQVKLTRAEQLQEVEKYLKALRSICVITKTYKGNREVITSEPIPLWNITLYTQESLIETGKTDIFATVRPGEWIVSPEASKTKDATRLLYSHIPKQVLAFHKKDEDWAFMWAIYTSTFAGADNSHTFKVKTLLEAVMPKQEIEKAKKDKRERHAIATRLLNQLKCMEKRGWEISCDQLKKILTPKGRKRRERGFFEEMLECSVTFTSPPQPTALLTEGEQEQDIEQAITITTATQEHEGQEDNKEKASTLSGQELKQQRQELGLSQTYVAKKLGLSQTYLSKIEKGQRVVTAKIAQAWEKIYKDHKKRYDKTMTKK